MTALQEAKHFPLPASCHQLHSPESLPTSPKLDEWPVADATGPFSTQGSADICLKSAFVVLRMFRYMTEVLVDSHMLANLAEGEKTEGNIPSLKASLPITIPMLACSAMQACYIMVMMLYRVKSTLVPHDILDGTDAEYTLPSAGQFQETERHVEELRHGIKDSLQMLERYQMEFAHVKAMYEELKGVYKVAFADV